MTTLGRLADAEQFGDIVLKTDATAPLVYLQDVARIELGAQSYDQTCTLDGKPSVALSDLPAARLQRPAGRRARQGPR